MMLKYAQYTALIAAIVFVAALATMVLFSSPKSREPAKQQTTESRYKEDPLKENEIGFFNRWFPDSTAVFNLFLALFTGILAFGGLYQLTLLTRAEYISADAAKAAKESAEIAKTTLIAAHRPWLTVSIEPAGEMNFNEGWFNLSYAEQERSNPDPFAANIMPEDQWQQIVHSHTGAEAVDKALAVYTTKWQLHPGRIRPTLIGAVTYKTTLDGDVHQTGIIREVGFWDSAKGITVTAIDPREDGPVIPEERVRIRRHPTADGDIN